MTSDSDPTASVFREQFPEVVEGMGNPLLVESSDLPMLLDPISLTPQVVRYDATAANSMLCQTHSQTLQALVRRLHEVVAQSAHVLELELVLPLPRDLPEKGRCGMNCELLHA